MIVVLTEDYFGDAITKSKSGSTIGTPHKPVAKFVTIKFECTFQVSYGKADAINTRK